MGLGKFSKRVAVRVDLDDGLRRLDKLTEEGLQTASEGALWASIVNKKVTEISDNVRVVEEKVRGVGGKAQVVSDNTVNVVDVKVQRIADGAQVCSAGDRLHD